MPPEKCQHLRGQYAKGCRRCDWKRQRARQQRNRLRGDPNPDAALTAAEVRQFAAGLAAVEALRALIKGEMDRKRRDSKVVTPHDEALAAKVVEALRCFDEVATGLRPYIAGLADDPPRRNKSPKSRSGRG
jgi:hypothetical protein